MREYLICSMRILWYLIFPFIYFYNVWPFSGDGLEVVPFIYSINSFSMWIKSIFVFHARKFDDPTNLFLFLQNEVIFIVYLYIDINILTFQVNMILYDDILNLILSWLCFFLHDLLQGCLRCDIYFNVRYITLIYLTMMEVIIIPSFRCINLQYGYFNILRICGPFFFEWM